MRICSLAALALAVAALAGAAEAAPAASGGSEPGSLLPGGNSKDPVSIEADNLVYADKEGKATYSGNVVLIQGPTKLTCSVMVLYVDKSNGAQGGAPTPAPSPAASGQANSSSSVRHMDCAGPVTVISKTQTATGDSAVYDKPQNRVQLIGNVTLSDGPNVTKGDKLTYDLATGMAHVETKTNQGKPGRVWSQFVPGSDTKDASDAADSSAKPAAPKPSGKSTPSKSSPAKP